MSRIAGAGVRARDLRPVPQAWHRQRDLLRLEAQVWWPGSVGRPLAESAGNENIRLKKILAEAMVGDTIHKDVATNW